MTGRERRDGAEAPPAAAVDAVVCGACGAENSASNAFCGVCGARVEAEIDSLIGKVIDDRFRIKRLLGSGGMGAMPHCDPPCPAHYNRIIRAVKNAWRGATAGPVRIRWTAD